MHGILFYEFDGFHLYPNKRQLLRDNQLISMKPKEFTVLLALVSNHGNLLTYREIREVGWPDTHVQESNITQTIYKLRVILGDDAEKQRLIETVPKKGYRFVGEVIEHTSEATQLPPIPIVDLTDEITSPTTINPRAWWASTRLWVPIVLVVVIAFALWVSRRAAVNEQPLITNVTFITKPFSGHQFVIGIDGQRFNPNNVRVVVTGPGCREFGSCVVPNGAIRQFGEITDSRLEMVPLTLAPGLFSLFVQNGGMGPPSKEVTFTVKIEGVN